MLILINIIFGLILIDFSIYLILFNLFLIIDIKRSSNFRTTPLTLRLNRGARFDENL